MRTADWDFVLPPERIAQQAAEPRDSARLLVLGQDRLTDHRVADLDQLLQPGDLLVRNRTRVIPARLFGKKPSGGEVEVLLIHPLDDDGQGAVWRCMIRGKVREGTRIVLGQTEAWVSACHQDGERDLRFAPDCNVLALAEAIGHIPLPPYIRRDDTPEDRQRYQTVFGDIPGSVAAPTASLHVTEALLARIAARGVETAQVELRIGPGTFKPVDVENVEDFRMHAEWCHCPAETAAAIAATRRRGGQVLALGTTVVRTLETAARLGNTDGSYQGWSSIFLYPPQQLLWVDRLLTNFHLPKSTLLMLVACLCGRERLFQAYQHAINNHYRFYSYGDAMLVG